MRGDGPESECGPDRDQRQFDGVRQWGDLVEVFAPKRAGLLVKALRLAARRRLQDRVVEGTHLQLPVFTGPWAPAGFSGGRIDLCRSLEQPLHRLGADTVCHGHHRGQLPDLELRHRRRARCEDRIRCAKGTELQNVPFHSVDQNRIWLQIVQLESELTAWAQMLAFDTEDARRWEPKRLRLRLFSLAGRIARHARRVHLRLSANAPHADLLTAALVRLTKLPTPA